MFNSFLTFGYKKAPDFLQNSLIFSDFLCFSLFFSDFPRIFNKIPYICIGLTK